MTRTPGAAPGRGVSRRPAAGPGKVHQWPARCTVIAPGLARGRARKSWPPVSGTGGADGSPAGHLRRPCVPASRQLRGSPACRPGPGCSPRGRAVRHFVRLRLHRGVMKRARRSFASFAALAKAGAAPGKREAGGTVPGGPGQDNQPGGRRPRGHHQRCHRSTRLQTAQSGIRTP